MPQSSVTWEDVSFQPETFNFPFEPRSCSASNRFRQAQQRLPWGTCSVFSLSCKNRKGRRRSVRGWKLLSQGKRFGRTSFCVVGEVESSSQLSHAWNKRFHVSVLVREARSGSNKLTHVGRPGQLGSPALPANETQPSLEK